MKMKNFQITHIESTFMLLIRNNEDLVKQD